MKMTSLAQTGTPVRAARCLAAAAIAGMAALLLGACGPGSTAGAAPATGARPSSARSSAPPSAMVPLVTAPPTSGPPATAAPAPTASSALRYYHCPSVLSRRQARRATGIRAIKLAARGEEHILHGETYCQFEVAGGALGMAVTVLTGPARAKLMGNFDEATLPGSANVPGLGDKAFWNGKAHILVVARGGTGFSVAFSAAGGSLSSLGNLRAKAIAVARDVLRDIR